MSSQLFGINGTCMYMNVQVCNWRNENFLHDVEILFSIKFNGAGKLELNVLDLNREFEFRKDGDELKELGLIVIK